MRTLASIVVLCLASTTFALTQTDIDRGAKRATGGLKSVTRTLASEKLEGRDNDTQGSFDAQAFLVKRLRRLGAGLAGGTGDVAYKQPFVQSGRAGTNLLAVIRGRELPDEYVVVGAHYDHLGDGHCLAKEIGRASCRERV